MQKIHRYQGPLTVEAVCRYWEIPAPDNTIHKVTRRNSYQELQAALKSKSDPDVRIAIAYMGELGFKDPKFTELFDDLGVDPLVIRMLTDSEYQRRYEILVERAQRYPDVLEYLSGCQNMKPRVKYNIATDFARAGDLDWCRMYLEKYPLVAAELQHNTHLSLPAELMFSDGFESAMVGSTELLREKGILVDEEIDRVADAVRKNGSSVEQPPEPPKWSKKKEAKRPDDHENSGRDRLVREDGTPGRRMHRRGGSGDNPESRGNNPWDRG